MKIINHSSESLRSSFLVSLVLAALLSASAQEVDLSILQPSLKRLDNLPRSAEDNAKIDLGRRLFYENRLSMDNSISCNSCHDLQRYGVDGEPFSIGFGKVRVGRNSPTVYNAFMHTTQFWDGRAPTVEEQAKGPILAGKEMAMPSPAAVVAKLKGIPEYRDLFKAAFPRDRDPLTYDNVGTAIGAFERLLTTPSRFDSYLDGNQKSLNTQELKGLQAFARNGCTTCHSGTLIGGQSYQKLGVINPWKNQADQGRFEVTKAEADKLVFKVPSLRNIAKTGPYFHDSSARTLDEAVRMMAKHQLGLDLPNDEVTVLVAFLNSLTGELPKEYISLKQSGVGKKVSFE